MLINLSEAKEYLRVDSEDEDRLIEDINASAHKICMDVSRLSPDDFEAEADTARMAVYYAIGYLYEHREEANYHELKMTVKDMLSDIRRAAF